jgi:hypothetical protein
VVDNSGFQGELRSNTLGSQYNAIAFVVQSLINRIFTGMPVKVMAVDAGAQTVDVLPLVNQVDGNGANSTPFVTVYGVPYFTLQGGQSGVIAPPSVGDLGWLTVADHDISVVKKTKAQGNPGSARRYSLEDGMYFGGALNAAPSQYLKFAEGEVDLLAVAKLVLTAGSDLTASASGKLTASASGDLTASAGGKATLSAGSTASVTGSLVQLGPGGGNLATAPAPAKSLFSSFAGSGPGAVLSNPTATSSSTLSGNLVPSGTIDTGLDGLVTGGTITGPEKTQITDALGITNGTPSVSLTTANTDLLAHTDRLSGLSQPTVSTQPFLGGVVGLGPGLDLLAGGLLGPSATAIPAASTGLTATTAITAANTYALGIVAYLAGGGTVATVLSTVAGHATTLNAYEPADTAAYASSQSGVASAGGFLSLVGYAKSTLTPVQTYFAQVCSPSNVDTLQSV